MEKLSLKYKKILLQPYLGSNTSMKCRDSISMQFPKYNKHFENVLKTYIAASEYLSKIPSYHIGYDYATKLMFSLIPETFVKQKINVLELCCGFGSTMKYLHDSYNCEYTGVDFNFKAINECAKKISELQNKNLFTIKVENILDFNYDVNKYDLVVIEDALTHIPEKEFLFRRIANSLNDNGLIVLSDLITTNTTRQINLERLKRSWRLYELLNEDKYKELFKKSGFTIINTLKDIGSKLVSEHNKVDMSLGDRHYRDYINLLITNKDKFIEKWGKEKYDMRFERLKIFDYINEGKLDYIFIVLSKKANA